MKWLRDTLHVCFVAETGKQGTQLPVSNHIYCIHRLSLHLHEFWIFFFFYSFMSILCHVYSAGLYLLSYLFTPVTFSSAPASWPPAADCYSSLPLLGQQQEELQRDPAAPPAPGLCQARAPATSPAQWGPPTGQGSRRGLWTQTSAPSEQLLSHQLPPHLLCRITPLRTHNHQVNFSTTCLYT